MNNEVKIKIRIIDNIFCQIENLPSHIAHELVDKYAILEPNVKYNILFSKGLWDGKRRFADYANGVIITYVNLITPIVMFLSINNLGHRLEIINNLKYTKLEIPELENIFDNVKLRYYQIEAVSNLTKYNDGFIEAGTGAGKTLCLSAIAKIMQNNNQKMLFMAPRVDLVDQMKETFELVGVDYSIYAGTKKDYSAINVISTYQTITRHPEIIKEFNGIMIDESHQMTAVTIEKFISDYCSHMQFRYGCTGTFPKHLHDQMILKCLMGDIRYTIKSSQLIKEGYLSTVNINPIKIEPTNTLTNEYFFIDWTSQCKYISGNDSIMSKVSEQIIKEHNKVKGNTLILVNNIETGEKFQEFIADSKFIHGKIKKKERQEVYNEFTEDSNIVRIASSGIASTGISIDSIHLLVIFDVGKSFTKVIQSIGRGLRKNDSVGKDHIEVLDIFVATNINAKHFRERKKYYKEANYPFQNVKRIEFKDEYC